MLSGVRDSRPYGYRRVRPPCGHTDTKDVDAAINEVCLFTINAFTQQSRFMKPVKLSKSFVEAFGSSHKGGDVLKLERFVASFHITHERWWYLPGGGGVIVDTESDKIRSLKYDPQWDHYRNSGVDVDVLQARSVIHEACIFDDDDALGTIEESDSEYPTFMLYSASNVRNSVKRVLSLVSSGKLIYNAPYFEVMRHYRPSQPGVRSKMDGFTLYQRIHGRSFEDTAVGRVDEFKHSVRFTDVAAFCGFEYRDVPPRNPFSGGWMMVTCKDHAPLPEEPRGGQFHWVRITAAHVQLNMRTDNLSRYGPRSYVATLHGFDGTVSEDWDAVTKDGVYLFISGHMINLGLGSNGLPVSLQRHLDLRRLNVLWSMRKEMGRMKDGFNEQGSVRPNELWHNHVEDRLGWLTVVFLLDRMGVKVPRSLTRSLMFSIGTLLKEFKMYGTPSYLSRKELKRKGVKGDFVIEWPASPDRRSGARTEKPMI
jgi:hypothetical protein